MTRLVAAVAVVALAVGYLAGGYVGLPGLLRATPITSDAVSNSVAVQFEAFTARCDDAEQGYYQCDVARSDGSDEFYAVTVNRDGCWFAQRWTKWRAVGESPAGRPVQRGCIN